MVPEPLKVLIGYLINTPHHDLCRLFDAVELAMSELEYDDIDEQILCESFITSFWIATKRDKC